MVVRRARCYNMQGCGLQSSPRLVLGENAAQAMQFAVSGSSQGGLLPLSLASAPAIAQSGTFTLISSEWHASEPLRQRLVRMKSAGDTARAFHDYLQQPAARAIFVRYGFVLPGEAPR
jgi:molybdate transport system substrate-binding protein